MGHKANEKRIGTAGTGDTGEGYAGDVWDMQRRGPLPRDGVLYIDWVDGDRYYVVINEEKLKGVECRSCAKKGNVEYDWECAPGPKKAGVQLQYGWCGWQCSHGKRFVCTNIDGLKSALGDLMVCQGCLTNEAACQFYEVEMILAQRQNDLDTTLEELDEKLLAQRQDDLDTTLEELEKKRAELESLSTLELVYHLSDASYLAGWWREWAGHKLSDRLQYIAAMALVEDIFEILEARDFVAGVPLQ